MSLRINPLQAVTVFFWAQKPDHPVASKFLEIFLKNYRATIKPFYMNACQGRIAAATTYSSGVNMIAVAYYFENNKEGNQDIAIADSRDETVETVFRVSESGEIKSFKIKLGVQPFCSWVRDYNDSLVFGWPELID